MPTIDLSAAVAWIALIVAIVSPVITTMLNNRHAGKMKEIEIYQEKRLLAISNYLKAAGKVSVYPETDAIAEYGEAYGNVIIYLPLALLEEVENFDINSGNAFKHLARKFAEHGFATKQKLW